MTLNNINSKPPMKVKQAKVGKFQFPVISAYSQIKIISSNAFCYNLYNLKNVKNSHRGVLLLVNFTKSNTPPWVFFTFFKLYK